MLAALNTQRFARNASNMHIDFSSTAHAGVAFGAALGLALVLVCMTLGQRACCPRPTRSRAAPLGGKPAPDIELGAKDPGLGLDPAGPGTGAGEIREAPAPAPAPWPAGDPGKGYAQCNGALSRAGSLQASRAASRQGSFSGRAWRSWRRMEELAGPAGGLEVTGLREGRPVVLYDGPLGKVPAQPHVPCSGSSCSVTAAICCDRPVGLRRELLAIATSRTQPCVVLGSAKGRDSCVIPASRKH